MEKIKITIVDDHVLFSRSLSFLIGSFKEFDVVGNYSNGKEFIQSFAKPDIMPDIVLLDLNMPIMDGVETMKWLKANQPGLKVIALSVNDDEGTIIKMITNGAKGYLLKDTHPKTLYEALLVTHNKGFYYSDMVSELLVNQLVNTGNKVTLKEREVEFIKLACTEKTYKEIASGMCLSPKTIDGYRENLFQKLEIKTRIGLVLYAIKNKIVAVEK
ncbi:response regulator transcription factor [Flavobacterium sp.]|uniref:response regulator transcription factor n=1 Tax=Flavobacterium sp. TaxID=239 RepID=UPI00286B4D7B|nr:response regulator transcription factor [Flavobacterium sp.]